MKRILLAILLTTSAQAEEISLQAKPFPAHCKVGVTCNIAAEHSITLKNTEKQERCYIVTYRICSEKECYTKEFNIKVNGGQTYKDKQIINLFKAFNYNSRHYISYFTAVYSPFVKRQSEVNAFIDVGL